MTRAAYTLFSIALLFLFPNTIYSQQKITNLSKEGSREQEAWVQKTFNALSDEEKIGQLFMGAAYREP